MKQAEMRMLTLDQCLKLFSSIAPFSLSTRRFRPPGLIKETQGSKLNNFI